MTTSTTGRGRRLVAVASAAGLAVLGLAAATAPSSSGAVLQKVGVSISSPTTVFTSTLTTTKFTVTNPSTNSGSVALFTIVVPPGVGKVSPAGVVGDGSWRQSVLPCGTTANCSSLVLVYATLPLSTSVLKPGKSVSPSISFTTPATAQALKFSFIGIGGGVFTTTDTPTLNVVSGDAADFTLTPTTSNSFTAGGTIGLTLQARRMDNTNGPFSGGAVRFSLGTDDARAVLTYAGVDYPYTSSPTSVDITLPASTSGTYPLTLKLVAAGNNSLTALKVGSSPEVKGSYAPITVNPGVPTTLTLKALKDTSQTPSLANPAQGQEFTVTYELTDQYGNDTTRLGKTVALVANQAGLGAQTVTDPVLGQNSAPGTIVTTFASPTNNLVLTGQLNGTPFNSLTTIVTGPGDAGTLGGTGLSLAVPGASANFPAGTGNASLVLEQCDPQSTIECTSTPNVLAITGDFVIGSPASGVITCSLADCPRQYGWTDGDHDWFCDWNQENCYGDDDEWKESGPGEVLHIDYSRPYADSVVYKGAGQATNDANAPWKVLKPCDAGNTIPAGEVVCRDLGSYTRADDGTLSVTVYFLIDPKVTLPGLK